MGIKDERGNRDSCVEKACGWEEWVVHKNYSSDCVMINGKELLHFECWFEIQCIQGL